MTCVMVWRNREPGQDDLWATSDTRISKPSQSSEAGILTEEVPKIYSLPIRCFKPTPGPRGGGFDLQCYGGSLGFAIAGSTLIAQSTILAVAPLLGHLGTLGELPTMEEIAFFVSTFAQRYMTSVNLNSSVGSESKSEIAVFGRCPKSGLLEAFVVRPARTSDGVQLRTSSFDLTPDDSILFLGDRKNEMRERVDAIRASHEPGTLAWWRSPRKALIAAIEEGAFPSIGGGEQLGITTGGEFNLYMPVNIRRDGSRDGVFTWLGVELKPFGLLGPCFLGLPGMHYN